MHEGKLIDQALEDEVQKEQIRWRDILKRLLDTILFLSKQNLAFRGLREDDESSNRGHFYE